MPPQSNTSNKNSTNSWLDWTRLVKDDNYQLFRRVLRGCRYQLLEAAARAGSPREQDLRMGGVQLCDLIESGWQDEIAKQVLGLPDEEPKEIPDYMAHEEPSPTEE